jgi:alpha-L-arabinofuranosidase
MAANIDPTVLDSHVADRVKAANGKVKYWEIWNKPPKGTGQDQTPADYAKIVVSAYNVIHAADPSFKVGLAAKSVHVNYLEQVINAGAKDHFDYIVLHPYEVLGGVVNRSGTESVYMHGITVMPLRSCRLFAAILSIGQTPPGTPRSPVAKAL